MTLPPLLHKAPGQPPYISENVLHNGGVLGSSEPAVVAQFLATFDS
jgi:hypothetical protein